ncbi:D-alanyl-D-alanine carboxypeptidase family protein [Brevundimonas sp. 2R-24]|uniref:D-alanyl-D-alanine carboxypeptidase family protein n=1 Tax=Peiella sedimenti TaxID=3061083 RepID=A0ABT8SJV8_9CAUL|nr:D-alanyl-D-alanine carboxypeptidase family protein [Caulobacteraceae bacterium XZ-24]
MAALFFGLVLATGGPAVAQETAYATPCRAHAEFAGAAEANAASLDTLEWSPFGPETGWEAYAPAVMREIGTDCPPYTPDFAGALAAWQTRWDLAPTGVFGPEAFQVLKGLWQERRPFVMARFRDECPPPPPPSALRVMDESEDAGFREGRFLRGDVLAWYRAMVRDARAADPAIAADPELLTLFSGYRAPEDDQLRCETEGGCDGVRRAVCSPHRTGTAIDLYVGRLPGETADSTRPQNRLHQSRGPAYRWLMANAHRYGFVNYLYEPWHWEWVGPPGAETRTASAP